MKPYSLDSGFQILFEDGERVFCRGWRVGGDGDRSAVLVVLPAAKHPSPSSLDRLTHEYGLKDELDEAWAVRPLELVRDGGRTMLVLEDPGGEPLDLLLNAPMEVGHFLRLATGIAMALGKLHQRGLVHKDIKPANILVNCTDERVRLTGFGIASPLPRERQSPDPPEIIAGTLAYMAPEQTGRMNRSIDCRSDLYSFGVTLYQMLTGTMLFTASDPMEWVHCHIARQPVPPNERLESVPVAVSQMILKLLAKTAEDRYQTAAGLERDLRRCQVEWEARQQIDDFPLGEHDTPGRLLIPEKLYGRGREVETLLASLNRIVNGGAPQLVLVSGYSGIGKSSVVNELQPVLVPPRGLFVSGKFDQYKRDIPYSTLAQAFQSLIRRLLGKSEAELVPWRDALREALGSNARLIVDLVPEVKLIIGEPPPVPELPPQDAQRRFQMVFRQFIGVFARPEHPLALFLDDLQWLDAATLDLLEDLLSGSDLSSLLLIGAYRDNEVTAAHPLTRKLEAVRATGRVQDIKLAPLTISDLKQLVADSLRCNVEHAAPLAELVHAKTGGNPFFVIQFLYVLADEGLVAFDHEQARWSWDLDGIHAKQYTNNVVDLLAGKLARLPLDTQEALRQLACLGNVADVSMLSIVLDTPEEQVHAAIWEALRQQLIDRLDRSYKFAHDRLQEAAYRLIPESKRAAAHLRIGRTLASRAVAEDLEETIFDIVNHLNRGATLISTQKERDQLAEFNLMAAKRAKSSTAYSSALNYLVAARSLLTEERWDQKYQLIFAIELNQAECEILTGDGAAQQRLLFLSERASNLVDASAVACLRQILYTTWDQLDRSVEVGLKYLTKVGIDWTPHPTKEVVGVEYDKMRYRLETLPIEAIAELPRMQEPLIAATIDVLTELVPGAYFTDFNLLCLVVGRIANLSFEHGNTNGSCYAYSLLGFILGSHFGNYQDGFRFGSLALNLAGQPGLSRFRARVNLNFAYCTNPWSKHIRTGRVLLRQGIIAALETGDLTFAAYTHYCLATDLLASGDALDITQHEVENGLEFASKSKFGLVVDILTGHLGLIRMLRGLSSQFGSFNDAQFDETVFEHHLENDPRLANPMCIYWIRKMQGLFYAGDYRSAIAASEKAAPLLWTSPASFEMADYHFYAGLAHAAHYDEASSDEQARDWQALTSHHQRIAKWADNCPENFESRAALLAAEIARIDRDTEAMRLDEQTIHSENYRNRYAFGSAEIARIGRCDVDAMRFYEEAIRSSRGNGFLHNEAIASELAGRFYLAAGLETNGYAHLRNARACFALWGAHGKVKQLESLYPLLAAAEGYPRAETMDAAIEKLDVTTVVKASQAVSAGIELTKLIERLMTVALENAGANRVLLISPRDDDYLVEAVAEVADGEIVVRQEKLHGSAAPESVIRYVVRTRESVILDDARSSNQFTGDDYLIRGQPRSVFCLPLVRQAQVAGVLYLENTLTSHVFTPDRTALLSLLASQIAISLENTRLYSDLREREAKIRRLVDANVIGITVTDLEGQMIEANNAFLEMVGQAREDLISGHLQWTDLTPPEWHDRSLRAVADLKRTGTFQPYEKEYFRKDGSRVPVLVGGAAFGESRDQSVAFVVDLTERKRAEVALRDSEEALRRREKELRDLLETIPAMTVTVLPDGSDVFIGKRFVEYSGFSEDKARRSGWKATIHPEDLDRHVSKWRSSLVSGEPIEIETRFRRADGEYRWFLARAVPLRDDRGSILKWYEVLTDIGDRKRAEVALRDSEEALRRSEAWLTQAQRLSRTGSWVYNAAATRYLYWSDESYRIWGLDPLQGLPSRENMWQRIHADDRERVWEEEQEALRQKRDFAAEFRIVLPDGTVKHLEATTHHVFSSLGALVEAVSSHVDVTERKRAQEEHERLRQLESDLAHMNRVSLMGELAASLVHEVTQPCASARNNARAALNFLDKQPPDLGEVREALDCILGDADRAGEIIDRIRDHIKKAPPRKERFDLNEAINEVRVLARSAITRNAASGQIHLTEGVLPVKGDRVQLQQVVLNLILNAVEAMGSVQEGPRELSISTEQAQGNGVLVAVRDTGPGIDANHLERVFEAFYTTKSGGVGMGLSICRTIIDAHGGRLWTEANEPRGAVFKFTLPGAEADS